jgi:hypothetical protein
VVFRGSSLLHVIVKIHNNGCILFARKGINLVNQY